MGSRFWFCRLAMDCVVELQFPGCLVVLLNVLGSLNLLLCFMCCYVVFVRGVVT